MNHHYLKSLSIQVLLANAGFNAKHWDNYNLPRARAGHLHDPKVKGLIEFFYPNIYDQFNRANEAFNGRPRPGDMSSETNYRFLFSLINLTLFWLQDAAVLLHRYPGFANIPPWSTMLLDPHQHANFVHLNNIVLNKVLCGEMETVLDSAVPLV